MKFDGSFVLNIPRSAVYEKMSNLDFLMAIIPDKVEATRVDDRTIQAVIKAGLSFIKGKFRTNITVEDKVEAQSLTVRGSGSGSGSSMDFKVHISLAEDQSGTIISWNADVNISGSAATLGQRMVDKAAKNYMDRLIESFKNSLGET